MTKTTNKVYRTEDIYRYYKNNKIKAGLSYLNYKEFTDILYGVNIAISNAIIEEGINFKFFNRLGFLRIRKNKSKYEIKDGKVLQSKQIPDWGATRKLWKRLYPNLEWKEIVAKKDKPLMYHNNDHSRGTVMRWYWDKRNCNIKNKTYYTFTAVKANKRKLATYIKDNNCDKYEY